MKAVNASRYQSKDVRVTYLLTLSNDLTGVKLRNDTLEDLVDDRGEHALVVILAEVLKNATLDSDGSSRPL